MFETKFSQKIDYGSGATRDDSTGKGRYDLIPPKALHRVAQVYERGAKNHGDNNWYIGIPFSRLMDSATRHLNQYKQGMTDEDHLGHAIFNILAMIEFEENGREDLNNLAFWNKNE